MLFSYRFMRPNSINLRKFGLIVRSTRNLHATSTTSNQRNDLDSKLKSLKTQLESKLKEDNEDWIKFYRFNYIKTASMITKAKIYQSVITAVIFLDSYYKYLNNQNVLDNLLMVNGLTLFSLVFLIVMGQMARKIIGIAYYSPTNPNLIRISHLSFFGRRRNLIVNLRDISPLSDTNTTKDGLFHKMVIYSNKKNRTFYLANNDLATVDEKVYKRIFGLI